MIIELQPHSSNDEFNIMQQKDKKVETFLEKFACCENCKVVFFSNK